MYKCAILTDLMLAIAIVVRVCIAQNGPQVCMDTQCRARDLEHVALERTVRGGCLEPGNDIKVLMSDTNQMHGFELRMICCGITEHGQISSQLTME